MYVCVCVGGGEGSGKLYYFMKYKKRTTQIFYEKKILQLIQICLKNETYFLEQYFQYIITNMKQPHLLAMPPTVQLGYCDSDVTVCLLFWNMPIVQSRDVKYLYKRYRYYLQAF